MVGNPILAKDQQTFDHFFNVAAFALPTPLKAGQTATWQNFGNMPRHAIRGPGVGNWNVSLFKNFTVKERLRFQLRAEAYNLFNHTQFSSVNTSLQFSTAAATYGQQIAAAAGQMSAARDPRIMQLALRLSF
jgi:hypothetical protein